MKAKKLVSLLLAALLLVSMVPTQVLAAGTPSIAEMGGTATQDVANVKLMLSTKFGAEYSYYNQDEGTQDVFVADTTTKYNEVATTAASAFGAKLAAAETNVQKANSAFVPEAANSIEVGRGQTFYLGVKVALENPSGTYKGVRSYNVGIVFDKNTFEVDTSNYTTPNAPWLGSGNSTVVEGVIATNLIGSEAINSNANAEGLLKTGTQDQILKYAGKFTCAGSAAVERPSNPNQVLLTLVGKSDNKFYFPSATTWDYVIPFKAKTDATVDTASAFSIEYVGGTSDKPTSIVLGKGDYTGSDITDKDELTTKNGVSDERLKSENVSVTPKDYSVPPSASASAYTGKLVNRKNLPYLAKNAGGVDANSYQGPYDVITMPEGETSFKVGDTLVVYGVDPTDETKKIELGRTVLTDANLFNAAKSTEDKAANGGWGGQTLTTGDALAAGQIIRLVNADGKSYLHTQNKVWIGRLAYTAGKNAEQSGDGIDHTNEAVNPNGLVEISITPETELNYSQNFNGEEGGVPTDVSGTVSATGTVDAPVEVVLGDTVQTVIDKFNTSEFNVKATVEDGSEVDTQLDWSNLKITGASGNSRTDIFTAIDKNSEGKKLTTGSAQILVPFKDQTGGTVHYTQPVNYLNEGVVADPPVYGAVIHVTVNPDPTDFTLVGKTNTTGTLTVSGGTAQVLQAGDQIAIFAGQSGTTAQQEESGQNATAIVTIANGSDGIQTTYDFTTKGGKQLPAVSEGNPVNVLVKYSETVGTAFEVPMVSDNAREVIQDEVITGEGGANYLVDPDQTVRDIFETVDPTFSVTNNNDVPVHVELGTVDLHTTVYKNTAGEGAEATWVALQYNDAGIGDGDHDTTNFTESVQAFNTLEKDSGQEYKLVYEIQQKENTPETPAVAAADGYLNSGHHTITIYTEVVQRVHLGNKANGTFQVKAGSQVNAANGPRDELSQLSSVTHWDTFQVEDTYKEVKVNDVVTVYDGNNIVTSGIVYEIQAGAAESDPQIVKIKVEQMGREPKNTYTFKITPMNRPSGEVVQVSESYDLGEFPNENFTYKGLVAFSPDSFTVLKTDFNGKGASDLYDAIKAGSTDVPKQVQVQYGYQTYNGTTFDWEEDTLETVSVDITSLSTEGLDAATDLNGFDGSKTTTVTPALTADLKAKDGETSIEGIDTSDTLSIKITAVEGEYNGPEIAAIAAATTVENNRYPLADKVSTTLTSGDKATVYFYTSYADASNSQNAVASLEVGAGSTKTECEISGSTAEILSKDGGKLWMSAIQTGTTRDTMANEASAPTVSYGRESYTLWGVSVTTENSNPSQYRQDLKDTLGAAGSENYDAVVEKVDQNLTSIFTIKAVRFVKGTGTAPEATGEKTATLTVADRVWGVKGAGAEGADVPITKNTTEDTNLAKAAVDNLGLTGEGEVSIPLRAVLTAEDMPASGLKVVDGEASVPVEFEVPTGVTAPDGVSAAEITLHVTDKAEDAPFELPANAADYITVSREGKDRTNDSITIRFADVTGEEGSEVYTPTDPNMANAKYSFKIGDTTFSGSLQMVENGDNDYYQAVVDKNTPNFTGVPAEITAISFTFTEPVAENARTASVSKSFEALSTATAVTNVTSPRTLHFMNGTILTRQTLMDMVDDITSVTVNDGSVTVPLVKEESGASNPDPDVAWTLKVKEGEGEWADITDETLTKSVTEKGLDPDGAPKDITRNVSVNSWVDAFAEYHSTKQYKLTAQLQAKDASGKDLENKDNLVAEVPIKVYNKDEAGKFPLLLTEGNNSVYEYGQTAYMAAPVKAQDDTNETWEAKQAAYEVYQRKKFARQKADPNCEGSVISNGGNRLTTDQLKAECEKYRNDMVFYWLYDSTTAPVNEADRVAGRYYVSDYLDPSAMVSLNAGQEGGMDETAMDTWLASATEGTDYSIQQLVVDDGTPTDTSLQRANKLGTAGTINPTSGIGSGEEHLKGREKFEKADAYYIIRYTVKVEDQLYVADRQVKITYLPGDTSLNQVITTDDGSDSDILVGYGGTVRLFPFTLEEGYTDDQSIMSKRLVDLETYITDTSRNGVTTTDDASDLDKIVGAGGKLDPYLRW